MNNYKQFAVDAVANAQNLKSTWDKMPTSCKTDSTMEAVQAAIGGSTKYGIGGKWSKDGNKYLALNGRISRSGMPLKLQTSDGDIPISSTDKVKLIALGHVAGAAPVEFE